MQLNTKFGTFSRCKHRWNKEKRTKGHASLLSQASSAVSAFQIMSMTIVQENEPESPAMVALLLDESQSEAHRSTLRQEDDNNDTDFTETAMRRLPEEHPSSESRARSTGEYSFVAVSGVLHRVEGSTVENIPSLSESAMPSSEVRATPASTAVPDVHPHDHETWDRGLPATLETEVFRGYHDDGDAVLVAAVEDESDQPSTVVAAERVPTDFTGQQQNDQSTTVVSAQRISNDYAATATVVETVNESDDDRLIRKLLQEDLIASGRSTDELQEYIRTASLENVVTRMNQRDEEEKTEIVEPDSALAWYLHEHELLESPSNILGTSENEHVAVAAMPTEAADVVQITEHDVHPAEIDSSDAQVAELIGDDYSSSYAMVPPAAAAVASIEATTIDEETATEVTVLDSKPAAIPNPWSEETTATVLETRPSANETWSRADEEVGEVTVDAIVEEEASVVDITEDVHPAEMANDVEAEFIGRAPTVAMTEDRNVAFGVMARDEAVVVSVAEDVQSPGMDPREANAALVGSGNRRSVSYSSPATQRPRTAARAVSDQPHNTAASPVDHATSGSFHRGIEALDQLERDDWMNRPSSFEAGDAVLLPPHSPEVETPMATAQVMGESDSCSGVPPLPSRTPVNDREPSRTNSTRTEESERSSGTISSGRRVAASSLQMLSTAAVRGTSTMKRSTGSLRDVLFGESRQPQHGFDMDAAAGSVLPRTLLPWSVFPKPNGTWVATVNTNQKALDSKNIREASKALRAFSCATQEQAEALARAWAPPRMLPFSDNPACFICESRFALLRRACHCRNCGVCVCSNCIVQWPSKMLPETYNIKKESLMNVCKSCDWLCSALRLALLSGQHDQAVAVHATGNVNLVTPFANVKGELFYPVHCAVLGGNLKLLRWLCDEHCCPLRSLRVGGKRNTRGSYTPILTSRGRSLLGIAMENRNLDIVRYLVADKNMSLEEEKGLSLEMTIQTLEAALHRLPSNPDGTIPVTSTDISTGNSNEYIPTQIPSEEVSPTAGGRSISFSVQAQPQETSPVASTNESSPASHTVNTIRDDASSGSVEDACIICFANTIDCVVTPCGHQICCMQCSTHITKCPVCSVDCQFIRVYR